MASRVARTRPDRRRHGARQHRLPERGRGLRAPPRGSPRGGDAARARAAARRRACGHRRQRSRFTASTASRTATQSTSRGSWNRTWRTRRPPSRSTRTRSSTSSTRRAPPASPRAACSRTRGSCASRGEWHDPARRARRDRHHPDLAALPLRRSAVEPRGTALLSGATLVVLDRFHPSTYWDRVRAHRVTWFYCLGVMPKLMLNIPPSPLDREHSVKRVTCSAIPRADHAAIEARWGVPVVRSLRHDRVRSRHRGRPRRPRRGRRHRLHRNPDAGTRGARGRCGRPAGAGGDARGARPARRRADGRLLPQPGRDRRRVPQRLAAHRRRGAPATSGGGSTTSRA